MTPSKSSSQLRDELETLTQELELHQTALCLNYNDWILVGLAIATALPHEGESLFQRISAIGYSGYSSSECSRKWKSLANSTKSVEIEWLYKHAENHGIRIKGKRKREKGKIMETMQPQTTQTPQTHQTPQTPQTTQTPQTHQTPQTPHPLIPSVWPARCCRMTSTFVRALIDHGIMSQEQAQWVTRLYWLGARRDGRVIFWQIDHLQQVHDGKVMLYGADCHRSHQVQVTWMSYLMRTGRDLDPVTHQRILPPDWRGTHCLFGQHLLPCFPQAPVCIVEAEKTAVICAVRLASLQCLWLATGGISALNKESFQALQGREVILFPDTDPDGSTFRRWSNIGLEGQRFTQRTVRVYDGLERLASAEQKRRKIDIADLMLEAPLPHDDAALLFPEAIVPGAALATDLLPAAEGSPPTDHDEPDLFAHDPLFAKPEVKRLVEEFGLVTVS